MPGPGLRVRTLDPIAGSSWPAATVNTKNFFLAVGVTMKIDAWLAELKIPKDAYRLVMLLPLVYTWHGRTARSRARNAS